MSPRVAVAVVGLAAVGVAGGRAGADAGESALRLVWFDPAVMAGGSEGVASAEAAALLARMGVTASWRHARAPEIIDKSELWVVLVGAGPEQASEPPILGATAPGHPLSSVVWVRVPNVRAAIGLPRRPPAMWLPAEEWRALGVAIGRVIAHEVVHARVPELTHGTGLMSSVLTRRQLTTSSLVFDPAVGYALQAALRAGRVPSGARLATAGARVQERDR